MNISKLNCENWGENQPLWYSKMTLFQLRMAKNTLAKNLQSTRHCDIKQEHKSVLTPGSCFLECLLQLPYFFSILK